MKRIICIIISAFLAFSLSSCSGGSYSAIGMVKSNFGNKATLDFMSFKGHYTFVLRENSGSSIEYAASLREGELSLYYENGDEWVRIATVKGGESVESSIGINTVNRVRVRVKTNGGCKGGSITLRLK